MKEKQSKVGELPLTDTEPPEFEFPDYKKHKEGNNENKKNSKAEYGNN